MLIKWNKICTSAQANVQINMMSRFFSLSLPARVFGLQIFFETFKKIHRPTSNDPFKEKTKQSKEMEK